MQQFKGYTKFGPNALLEFEPIHRGGCVCLDDDHHPPEVYHRIGGFDPAFSRGCEEVDLCMKSESCRLIHSCTSPKPF